MSKQLAKKFNVKYMPAYTQQPVDVGSYVYGHILPGNSVSKMFARLVAVLASRGFLHAAEVLFIVTGVYERQMQYSDWTPEQEIAEGLQSPKYIKGIE